MQQVELDDLAQWMPLIPAYSSNARQLRNLIASCCVPGPNGEEYCWWQCTVMGGREGRDIDAITLAQGVEALGAGEIMLNCIDRDGTNSVRLSSTVSAHGAKTRHVPSTRLWCCACSAVGIDPATVTFEAGVDHEFAEACTVQGFDCELVKAVTDAVTIPVIASSGAGCPQHFTEVLTATNASAALAAGIFHRDDVEISAVKEHMHENGVPTRLQ